MSVALVAILSACGAAGAPDAATSPPVGTTPTVPTSPGGGATTTAQQRMTVLDAVQSIVGSLPPTQNIATNTKAITDVLSATGQFSDVGSSSDGTIWATFTSGQMLFIVNSDPPSTTPGSTVIVPSAIGTRHALSTPVSATQMRSVFSDVGSASPFQARANSATPPFGTVPSAAKFQLFNAFGSYFSGSDPRSDISAMLTANGYTGTTEDATLSALREVSGDGIFYFRGHGGRGSYKADGSTRDIYALWTATEAMDPIVEASDSKLTSDLAAHRVVYMLFRDDWLNNQFQKQADKNRHYGITDAFINQYMTFTANSLIYIDACESANSPELRSAFINGSVFAGWTERVAISAMGQTSRYVFDRMLGANTFVPETPKQRPFQYDALAGDPKFGSGKAYGYSSWPSGGSTITAQLQFTQLGGDFGILAPAIQTVIADDLNDQLLLLGYFGDDPKTDGKVVINDGTGDVALAVVNWTSTVIKAGLPRTGAGSFGNVTVSVRGHKSNVRQLIDWDGTFSYTSRDLGTLGTTIDMDVRIRADPQDVRLQIGVAPVPSTAQAINGNLSTAARYTAGGTWTGPFGPCTATESWAGSGTIAATPTTFSGKAYNFFGAVVAGGTGMTLTFDPFDPTGLEEMTTLACPTGTTSGNDAMAIGVSSDLYDTVKGALQLPVPLDGTFNIAAGSRQRMTQSSIDGSNVPVALKWSLITARPTVDKTLPK